MLSNQKVQGNGYDKKIAMIFWALLLLSIAGIFGWFLLGRKYYIYTDIGTDTFYQYYPYFVNMATSIRDGSFAVWNWDYGLGTSFLNMILWTFDPFAFVVILLGAVIGPGSIHYLLIWMQVAKIIVLFVFCKKFLRYHLKDEFAVCLGAYFCALNGFLLLWGQHYFLGTSCIFMILIFCAVEHFLHNNCKKGGLWVALSVGWTLLYSFYTGYMILIVAAVYFLYRYFTIRKFKTIKDILYSFGRCIFSVLTGVFLSGVILIPACYYTMTNSSRLSGAVDNIWQKMWITFISSMNFSDLGSRLSRLLSNNLMGINDKANMYFSNYYEAPQLFCTLFIFFLFGQWIVYKSHRAKESRTWASFVVKLVLLYFLIFNSVTGLILNAFAYPSYRYTFLIFPLIGICVGEVWQEVFLKKRISISGIGIGSVLSIWAWVYSYEHCSDEVKRYVMVVFILLAAGFCILLFAYFSRNKKYTINVMYVFLALACFTTVFDHWVTTNYRGVVTKERYSLEWEKGKLAGDTREALDWIKERDTSFYRIAKTYEDWHPLADSFIEKYSTPAYYNSTANKNIADFYDYIYSGANTSMKSVKFFRADTELDKQALNLINCKYILSDIPIENQSWLCINQIGKIYIYQNTNTESIAKWYTETMSKDVFCVLAEEEKAALLSNTVVLEEVISTDSDAGALIEEFSLESGAKLKGKVDCKGKGVLMVAIPDQQGWELYVDGEKTETYNCDFGFLGVRLESGHHDILLKYHIPMAGWGAVMTLFGMAMMIMIIVFEKRVHL